MASLIRILLVAVTCMLSTANTLASNTITPTTTIRGKLRLPNDTPVNTTRVTLNNNEYTTYTQSDGSFAFYNVPPGVHLLDVQSLTHLFSHVKIQLLESAMTAGEGPKCIEYAYPGAPKQAIPHPLLLTAHAKYQYFEPRQGFSILSILKNPMLLMMLVSGVLMFMMPKMMENLDPEQKEQMQKQMEMQSDPQKMLSQLWGDIAGGAEGADTASKKAIKGTKNSRRTKRD
eukprot:CAMPEP_0195511760 /NCGR_PEP_ID=MMETSP0794_2-20130614/3972_1 /TAXON_ID=515487 /ORGANISM="Stephanopyxis turris, Strain CCMP 815" /LENGTH=229 /DNA_ID=CAMNT_0040639417 /DNA_START=95 /DNA_END=784 /DNA_ORIENTATION=+